MRRSPRAPSTTIFTAWYPFDLSSDFLVPSLFQILTKPQAHIPRHLRLPAFSFDPSTFLLLDCTGFSITSVAFQPAASISTVNHPSSFLSSALAPRVPRSGQLRQRPR